MFSNLLSNITQSTEPGQSFAIVTWTAPTVTDNSGSYTLTSTYTSGSSFTIGTTRVTYNAIDANGNTASYFFYVIIVGEYPAWGRMGVHHHCWMV